MSVLDVFNTDPFNVVSLTEAINLLPFKPQRIGQMGLFSREGITTTTVLIEELKGQLTLLPTVPRGGPPSYAGRSKRTMRALSIPHIPHNDMILADDVQGVRAFGSENATQSITAVVNNRLQNMRQNHELTLEFHRIGAIKGVLVDADGTTIYNLFEEFEVTPNKVDFVLGTTTTDQLAKCLDVIEAVEDALGSGTYDHIHAFCGSTWFRSFISHTLVKAAFDKWRDGAFLRNDPRAGFEFGNIIFEQYRGSITLDGGSSVTPFIAAGEARFFPVGVPNLFKTYDAPADFVETVNTVGRPVYAKQERLEFDRGIKMHTQSNPLTLCLRPKVLVRGYTSN